jgi:cytochrome c oxidase subunit 2
MGENFDWKFGFQDPATPIMEGIIDLHNHIFFYLILIFFFVGRLFFDTMYVYFYWMRYPPTYLHARELRMLMLEGNKVSHGTLLEIIWTVTPSIILVVIAIPSFALLYSMDEVLDPMLTVKAIGHQWYWAYEFSDFGFYENNNWQSLPIIYDSNMMFEDELFFGEHRLLQVDRPITLPTDVHIRIIITSMDVLHSWAVPALGVKVDAVPGRLNQTFIYLNRPGSFYGQCSELCGVNHGFMPIHVRAVDMHTFNRFLNDKLPSVPSPY